MKTDESRFKQAIAKFPQVTRVLEQLDAAQIPYRVGGSVALYTQGNDRLPHDVDIMFTNEAHDQANALFGLTSAIIERPNVRMHKSTPIEDGTLDFLSHYTVIADGKAYHHPPLQKVGVQYQGRIVNLIPAEKIAAIKLIGRREHHHDLSDVTELINHPDFDHALFWEMVDLLDARDTVNKVITENDLQM